MEKAGTEIVTVVSKVWEVRKLANEIMYYGGITGAVLFGTGAVILFFVFHIYAVVGELTGITAKRSIRKIQKEGYEGKSKLRAIHENTDKIVTKRDRTTGRLQPRTKKQIHPDSQNVNDETTVLQQTSEAETTVLYQDVEDETTVLKQPQIRFEVVEDIVITHSEVVLEKER